jgi:tetratricopeptide (TPR) repeat protein
MQRGLLVISAALALVFALLSTTAAAHAAGSLAGFPSDPQGAIRSIRARIASGDMSGAIQLLATYVAAHPEQISPRRFLGDLYFRNREIEKATLVYQAILRSLPQDKETHNRLGTVYAEQNRIDDAIAQFEAALPGTDSVGDLVRLHQLKGDFGAYEVSMEQLARAYPRDAVIQAELGDVYDATYRPDAAAAAYHRALFDDPNNLFAMNGLGLAFLNLHQFQDAQSEFQLCLRIDDTQYQCAENLAATLLETGRFNEAKPALDAAYNLAPERAETFVNYGYLADAQDDWQLAVADYVKAIDLYPYLPEAYVNLALDYENHALYSLAQAVVIKGIASAYDDGRMRVLLGDAYAAQGDRNNAMLQFQLGAKGSNPEAASIAAQRVSVLEAAPAQH